MAYLKIEKLCFTAGSKQILRDVDLEVRQGEFITILGPSGSGKTSLLMAIAGFNRITSGSILLHGKDITGAHPRERNFGVVFQNYALFPHYSVTENLSFPLRIRGKGGEEIRQAVERVAALVDLGDHLEKRPSQLSGGQQQRVALARALVYQPDIILLDEPLSALDVQLRSRMQSELVRIHRETGATIINITHDQQEALSVSSRVVVMNEGVVVEDANPVDIYYRPQTAFSAAFIGDSNVIPVEKLRQVAAGEAGKAFADDVLAKLSPTAASIVIKPEHLSLERQPEGALLATGKIVDLRFAGETTHYVIDTSVGALRLKMAQAHRDDLERRSQEMPVYVQASAIHELHQN